MLIAGTRGFDLWFGFCDKATLPAGRLSSLELVCFPRVIARSDEASMLLTRRW